MGAQCLAALRDMGLGLRLGPPAARCYHLGTDNPMSNTNLPELPTPDPSGAEQRLLRNSGDPTGLESPRIKSPVLAPIERSFSRNMQDLASLRAMPGLMAGFIEVSRELLHIALRSVVKATIENSDKQLALDRVVDEICAYPTALREPGSQESEKLRARIGPRLVALSEHPSYGPTLTSAMKVLRRTAALSSWTAFECVATDSWVAVLDENPIPLGQRALSSLPGKDDGGVSAKHISVGLAAKHGFDLRHCLGTLLRSRFDFTCTDGIRDAFRASFGDEENSEELQAILSKPILKKLEATRNLIVHRAGVVDEEYNRQMSSDLPIGEPLELSDEQISEFIEGAGLACGAILLFLDDWLESTAAA